MKKIISMLLCVTMMVFALALVSCGEEEHVHQYNRDKWVSDATAHWYAATCDCKDAGVVSRAAHSDPMNNGFCEVCGYNLCDNTENKYSTNYVKDDFAHWHEPLCDCSGQDAHVSPKADFEPHQYDTYEDGSLKSMCNVEGCGYQCARDEYDSDYSYDKTHHWFASACGHYDHDGLTLTKVGHVDEEVYEDSTRVGDGVCDVCGFEYCVVPEEGTEEYEAFYKTDVSFDGEYHWYEPKCNHMHDFKDHEKHADLDLIEDPENPGQFIPNPDGTNGFCDVCGKSMNPEEETPAE